MLSSVTGDTGAGKTTTRNAIRGSIFLIVIAGLFFLFVKQ